MEEYAMKRRAMHNANEEFTCTVLKIYNREDMSCINPNALFKRD